MLIRNLQNYQLVYAKGHNSLDVRISLYDFPVLFDLDIGFSGYLCMNCKLSYNEKKNCNFRTAEYYTVRGHKHFRFLEFQPGAYPGLGKKKGGGIPILASLD